LFPSDILAAVNRNTACPYQSVEDGVCFIPILLLLLLTQF
jgi:hypothetical protein